MYKRNIDGTLFKQMLKAGLINLKANIDTVNDLNVFPIPDGDTGDNMYSTLYGGYNAVKNNEDDVLSSVAVPVGEGALLGARGNSGVILSQMLAGMTEEFAKHECADAHVLSAAFSGGVKKAYASVSDPVEGTMLTVMREAGVYADKNLTKTSTVASYLFDWLNAGRRALEMTPSLLDVLREAGVVDSGGAGLIYIVSGFLAAVKGEEPAEAVSEIAVTSAVKDLDFSLFTENSVMQFGYCTEFLLQLTRSKCDIEKFSLEDMKREISIYGDSLVAVKTGSIIKIHIHTMTPGSVLNYAQKSGEFLTLKIENMTLQHNETLERKPKNVFRKNLTRKKFAVVAVADGEGLKNAFKELGVDIVIDGGQGNNPSVEVFLDAFDAVNSDCIFVLPDNGNILMAAEEAGALYKPSDVRVIKAKNFGDGYAALSALDYSTGNADEIADVMQTAIDDSVCACVSKAVRDTKANGLDIKDGDYIGFVGKNILVSSPDKLTAAKLLAEKLGADEKNFVIAFYGADTSADERELFESYAARKLSETEFYGMDGGQQIYDFILILQ